MSLTSTETLMKEGGGAWQLVADLPSPRDGLRGLGLDQGRFMVTGECWEERILIFTSTPRVQTSIEYIVS